MSRAPVTIAILAWNSWDTTRACLDSLRPTLGMRDQVIVVDNGSTDSTAAGLRLYPWVEVITNSSNRGMAIGWNETAARARHDIVIFLHNDTLLVHQWIDPLVAAFEDAGLGAAGPRSDCAAGSQEVPALGEATGPELRRLARQWAREHRGSISEAPRLNGFCLAVRRDRLAEVGGFDEGYGPGGLPDADLSRTLVEAGYRLAVCHGSFVHHAGHRTYEANGLDWVADREKGRQRLLERHGPEASRDEPVLVSACLIVKDEEDRLGECLASLDGFADEVIVYDTGSTDRTVAVAEEAGATVIEGYWDDDFSRARNEALGYCRGDWVVWVDADETLQTSDRAGLRAKLVRTATTVDAYSVRIQNLTGVGVGSEFSHHAARLFRRRRCEWTGRLHEQIARRETHDPIVQADIGTVWIRHTGYLNESLSGRNKAERNVRVAQAEVDSGDGWDRGYSLTSLGRSLLLAGRAEDALERLTEALECTDNGITRRLAVRTAVDATVALGRLDEALSWALRQADEGTDRNTAAATEAGVRVAREEWSEALDLLADVVPGISDADGFAPPPGLVAAQKARALSALGQPAGAADVLLGSLSEDGVLDTHLGELVQAMISAGRPLEDLSAAIPADRVVMFMAQILQLQDGPADAVLEACFSAGMNRTAVLATASKLAPRLPVERAMVWSFRLRQAGQAQLCPLVAIARGAGSPVPRARAAAAAFGAFGDPRAADLFYSALNSSSGQERDQIVEETSQLAPPLVAGAQSLGVNR